MREPIVQLDFFDKLDIPSQPRPEWSDPSSPEYNEIERLPPDWRHLVGAALYDDRRSVGSLADVLECIAPEVRNEWRALLEEECAANGSDDNEAFWDCHSRVSAFEDEHGIVYDAYGFNLRDPKTGEWIVEQW